MLVERALARRRIVALVHRQLALTLSLIPGSVLGMDAPQHSRESTEEVARTGEAGGNQRNYEATDWHPVTRDRAIEVVMQARELIEQSESLIEEIIAERAAAEAEARRAAELAAAEQAKPERKPEPV